MNLEQWRVHLSEAYEQAQLTLTPEKERSLFKETESPVQQGHLPEETLEVLIRYFFNKASCGEPFGSLHRIKERFGRSLEENYGLTEGPFMDLAKAYWTFKLEVKDLVKDFPYIGLSVILKEIEADVASVFFPTPGPFTIPLKERLEKQREMLSTLAPKMDIERFLAESPLLKPKRKDLTDNHQSKIRSISESESDEFKPVRGPLTGTVFIEKEWYVDQAENILGILTLVNPAKDWGYVILGRDERGQFRAIDWNVIVVTQDEARELLLDKMVEIHDSGKTIFPQGD